MAIYNGRILMRKGNEADFDAEKLMAGEWAVSLDKGIVRICLQAGKVIRMATYEAFEEDMKQIEAILLECQSIEEAVRRINTEVNNKLNACAEYVQQAKGYSEQSKQYRDEALQFRNEAEQFAPEGYAELKEQVNENTFKVDTIIEKADLGIKETASGEEIYLTDSAEGKAVEFALYGKARQNTTSGKNLLPYPYIETTHTDNGITYTDNGDGTVTANGTATGNSVFMCQMYPFLQSLTNGVNYKISGCPIGGSTSTYKFHIWTNKGAYMDIGNGIEFTFDSTISDGNVAISILSGTTVNNLTFYPMLRLASISDNTYEPYTNGASPNPDYPQEIEVSGESYNLLENTATSKTENGGIFTVNADKSVTVNGTISASTTLYVNESLTLEAGDYVFSGGYGDKNLANGYFMYIEDVNVFSDDNFKNTMFTLTEEKTLKVRITVRTGAVLNNVTFYPMIRKASVKNDRYMPYGKGSVEVKSLGKNYVDFIPNVEYTHLGLKFSKSDDGLGTKIVGTSTEQWGQNKKEHYKKTKLKKGKYKVISYVSGTAPYNPYVILNANGKELTNTRVGSKTFELVEDSDIEIFAVLREKDVVIDCVLYAMVCREEDSDEYEPYKETLSTIPTENGLAGIPVSSGGNYTDQNGQQWICDEVVKYADGSGALVQRISKVVFDGTTLKVANAWSSQTNYNRNMGHHDKNDIDTSNSIAVMSDYFVSKVHNSTVDENTIDVGVRGDGNKAIFLKWKDSFGLNTTDLQNAWLQENNVTVYYVLAEPITTPLTSEELAEISTFYPVTNISNDFDCGMKVKYNCDSKNYIDKQLAEMEKAREQAMMSMFLLLPEETQATMIENDVNNLLTESEN